MAKLLRNSFAFVKARVRTHTRPSAHVQALHTRRSRVSVTPLRQFGITQCIFHTRSSGCRLGFEHCTHWPNHRLLHVLLLPAHPTISPLHVPPCHRHRRLRHLYHLHHRRRASALLSSPEISSLRSLHAAVCTYIGRGVNVCACTRDPRDAPQEQRMPRPKRESTAAAIVITLSPLCPSSCGTNASGRTKSWTSDRTPAYSPY